MKTKAQLKNEIRAVKDWRHPFELENGEIVENIDKFGRTWLHDFQIFKRDILLNIIRNVVPGLTNKNLKELSGIDIGCNDGYFSFEVVKSGLKKCVGIELREDSIARANLIKDYYEIENLEFRNENMEKIVLAKETYHVTLFLGLLYHLTSPIKVLTDVSSITENVLIIMTFIQNDDKSSLRLIREDRHLPGSGAMDLVTRPSEKAVVDMLDFVGFNEVARYYPYPFFDFGERNSAGINIKTWAIYIASKSDKNKNIGKVIQDVKEKYDKNIKKPQWVILKNFDNSINCLLENDKPMNIKNRLKRKIVSWLK